MTPEDLIADLRSRINPAYANQIGTESWERKLCADALEAQADEIERLKAQEPAGLYVGRVQYVRAGGNAGLAWYVAPDYESVDYGYQPNDGDKLYAVPNGEVQRDARQGGSAGTQGYASGDEE